MSDGIYVLGAIISLLAFVAGIWNEIRRMQIMRRLRKSLTKEQLEALGFDVPDSPKEK